MELLIISFFQRAMINAVPLLFASTGEIVTERSGILNLGVEGMMALGAFIAFAVSFSTGSLLVGILAAMGSSGLLALVHGVATIGFKANQTVSGLAITMVGVGLAGFWGKSFVGLKLPFPDRVPTLGFLTPIPFIGPVLGSLDLFFWGSLVLAAATWFFLHRTTPGLWIRTVGENPRAAEAQGLPVETLRYGAVVFGGMAAGLAGAYLSLSMGSSWIENTTGGRGWVAVALTILALWNPLRAIWAAGLFGLLFVLQFTLQPFGISSSLLEMLPYLATLTVLVIDGLRRDHRHLGAPASLGEPYSREER